jgi:hypothetical protein
MHDVTPPTFDEGHHETSVIGWTQGITVGSWTFQPLIQSQTVKSTSPKAVMKVKSRLAFGRTYGPKPAIIQPNPAMNNGAVDQIAQENQMNSEDDQGHGPFVVKRMELKPHLRLQLAGAEEDEVIRGDEEMVDIQQAKDAAESDGGIHHSWH